MEYGGVRFPNVTFFDLSGSWADTRERSLELTQAWTISSDESSLSEPPAVPPDYSTPDDDYSSFKGPWRTRKARNLQSFDPGCNRTCADIDYNLLRSACEEDMILSNGDASWACVDSYVDPIILAKPVLSLFRLHLED